MELKPYGTYVKFEVIPKEERSDDLPADFVFPAGVGKPHAMRMRVTGVGHKVTSVKEGDIAYVKNFKPIEVGKAKADPDYIEAALCEEGNILAVER